MAQAQTFDESTSVLEGETDAQRVPHKSAALCAKIFRLAQELREEARAQGICDMSMDEIDAEISACRRQRRERQALVRTSK